MSELPDKCPQGWSAEELMALAEGDRTENTDALELHVRECEVCARELRFLRNMIAILKEHPESFHPDESELVSYVANKGQTDDDICAHVESCEECARDIEIIEEILSAGRAPQDAGAVMPDSLAHALEKELGLTRAVQTRPSWPRRWWDWLSEGSYTPMLTLGTAVAALVVALLLIPMWPKIKDASREIQESAVKETIGEPRSKTQPAPMIKGKPLQSVRPAGKIGAVGKKDSEEEAKPSSTLENGIAPRMSTRAPVAGVAESRDAIPKRQQRPLEQKAQGGAAGSPVGFPDRRDKESPESPDESTTVLPQEPLKWGMGDTAPGGSMSGEGLREQAPAEESAPLSLPAPDSKPLQRAYPRADLEKSKARPAPMTPPERVETKAPRRMYSPQSREIEPAKEKDLEQKAKPSSGLQYYGSVPSMSLQSPAGVVPEPRGGIEKREQPTREETKTRRRMSPRKGRNEITKEGRAKHNVGEADKLEERPGGPVFGKPATRPSVDVRVVDHIGRPIPWLKYSPTAGGKGNRRSFPLTVSAGQNFDWIRRQFQSLKKPIRIVVRVFGHKNNYTLIGEVIDPKTSSQIHEAQIGDELSKDDLQDALNELVEYLIRP